ncbi:MAG: glycosyltransferase [Gammaproteobacteria bacterium]
MKGNQSNRDNNIIIKGSGVDHNYFIPAKNKPVLPCVILGARMLIDKGIREYVDAARMVKREFSQTKFILAGDTDSGNPAMIPKKQLDKWNKEGVIEWIGHEDVMLDILQKSNIACLPSYREGMPKFLLEAASCGLAIVTTDVPGCREIVENNVNGFLVDPKDSKSLADSIKLLVDDLKLREKFGKQSRVVVENTFSSEIINKQTISFYKLLFNKK